MKPAGPAYRAYMLRIWLAEESESPVWHASLEHPKTGERLVFASLPALIRFLEAQTDLTSDQWTHIDHHDLPFTAPP